MDANQILAENEDSTTWASQEDTVDVSLRDVQNMAIATTAATVGIVAKERRGNAPVWLLVGCVVNNRMDWLQHLGHPNLTQTLKIIYASSTKFMVAIDLAKRRLDEDRLFQAGLIKGKITDWERPSGKS